MKIIIVFLMLFNLCSCCDINNPYYSDNPNKLKKHDKVAKIMNDYFENGRQELNIATDKKRIIFEKIRGPLNLDTFFELYKEKYDIYKQKDTTYIWSEFIRKYEDGGEIFFYRCGFEYLAGEEGYVLIKDNKVLSRVVTAFQ